MVAIDKTIEARAVKFAADVAAVQATHIKTAARFAFMLPAKSGDEPTDSKPPECDCCLAAAVTLPVGAEEACRVDEYLGPQGAGYVAHVEFTQDGKRCRLSQNIGPETWRNWGPGEVDESQRENTAEAWPPA